MTVRQSDRLPRATFAYDVVGAGPPLILLHGLSGSGRWWDRNIAAFSASFRTYTVDLPGFGESRAVRWSRLDDIVDRLAVWMAEEGLPRASLAGHSLGGAVAARLASRHPDRVDRLVLVAAAIRPRGARATARAGDVWRLMGHRSPGFAPMLVHDLLRCHPRSFVAAAIDALQTDWEPHLSRISAPTLVVWGEHDSITPIGFGHRIAAAVPAARLAIVPGAGHSPMWERPEAFNAEILRFLGDPQDVTR
ncbi:MAG: alpha/beta fold hydrolase [Thermomicrobiales bacterium]